MEFGVDGMLYVTTGDSGQRDIGWAQKRSNLHGNIIRITDSGGIPEDNPFTGEETARCNETGETDDDLICQEVFAYGLRNPFRFAMDPHMTDKVRFLVSDVGQKTWEEISVGGTDYAGANYGWPLIEGPCDLNSVDKGCSIGDPTSELTDPLYWYQHNVEEQGCAVGIAIPPPTSDWPSPYNDPSSFFFADFVFGELYHVTEEPGTGCSTCTPPTHSFRNETFHEWGAPIGLKFGPYIDHSEENGDATSPLALYYTYRKDFIYVRRIVYKGGQNFSPTVSISVNATNVVVGKEAIEFDASATTDRNHATESLTYSWDFGDGRTARGMVVSHRFNASGVYRVELTVEDPLGAIGQSFLTVSVGAPPSVTILQPAEGARFAVGDVLTLMGTGTDHLGNPLDSTQLTWEVRQHHANHFHPFLDADTPGNNLTLTKAPSPEDLFAAGNSYLEILLTGTDNDGVPTTVSRKVLPKTVHLDFDTEPTGLVLSLDEELLTMPHRALSWEGHRLRVVVPDEQEDGYIFKGWKQDLMALKSGNFQEMVVVVPANQTSVPRYVAMFEKESQPANTTSDSSPRDEDENILVGDSVSSAKTVMAPCFLLFLTVFHVVVM